LELIFSYIESHRVAPKSKPLSNYQKIVLKPVNEMTFLHQIKV